MAQMIFTDDFTASVYSFGGTHAAANYTFKRGNNVGVDEVVDFGMNKHLVAIVKVNGVDTGFDVTNAPLTLITDKQAIESSEPGNKYVTKNSFTPKNIIIGLLVVVAVVGGLKIAKII